MNCVSVWRWFSLWGDLITSPVLLSEEHISTVYVLYFVLNVTCVCVPTRHIRMFYVIQLDGAKAGGLLCSFSSRTEELQCPLQVNKKSTWSTRPLIDFSVWYSVYTHWHTNVLPKSKLRNHIVAIVLEWTSDGCQNIRLNVMGTMNIHNRLNVNLAFCFWDMGEFPVAWQADWPVVSGCC